MSDVFTLTPGPLVDRGTAAPALRCVRGCVTGWGDQPWRDCFTAVPSDRPLDHVALAARAGCSGSPANLAGSPSDPS